MAKRRIRNAINNRIRERLKDAAVEKGADAAAVEDVLNDMESDRPFVDWLLNGGFEKILELIMKLLAVMGPEPVPA